MSQSIKIKPLTKKQKELEIKNLNLLARKYKEREEEEKRFKKEMLKIVDKVRRDYRKTLTPYLKKFPMKEIFPKEMDALDKVRKEIRRNKK